jgi:uncharacterized protein
MPPNPKPREALREVATTYLAVAVVCVAAGLLRGTRFGPELAPALIAGAFLFTALEKARRDEGGAARFGIDLGGLLAPRAPGEERSAASLARDALREIGVALLVGAVTLAPYTVAYLAYHSPSGSFSLDGVSLPPTFVIGQLIVVALPEEAFFRGFVQTRLNDAFSRERRVLGVRFSMSSLLVQAALFAVVHVLVEPNPARLAVFFPALVFGLLREARGGIGAAVVYHAMCNVFSEVLFQGLM